MPSDKSSTLVELLRWRAVHQTNQKAYTFLIDGENEGASLTYGELDYHARAIGALLESYSVKGERVLLLYPPGLEFITAFFGCLYAGTVAVPAYPPRNKRYVPRIETVAKDAQARILLTLKKTQTKIQAWLRQTASLNSLCMLTTDSLTEGLEENWEEPDINGDSLAFLQYTSGSTGAPKGVMVSHDNLLHNLTMLQTYFGHTPESRGVIWLPPYHDMGLIGGILQPFFVGFPVVLMAPAAFLQRPIRWLRAISMYGATTSGGPNSAYELCVTRIPSEQHETLDLRSWDLAFNGAELVHSETLEQFAKTFAACGFRKEAFYPCYGLAEATLFVSGGRKAALPVVKNFQASALRNRLAIEVPKNEEKSQKLVGCGQSILEQKIEIVNPKTLTRCSPGQIGEIWVSGPSITQGYWRRTHETEKTFRVYLADTGEGPFLRTGDLGFLQDGELFVNGRLKDLIIIWGRNHYPQDIEWTVEHCHPSIRRNCSAAFSIEVKGEERLVIVAEVERRYARRKSPQMAQHEEVELLHWTDLNNLAKALPFNPGLFQFPDFEEDVAIIRQAIAEHHELKPYGIVLIKTTTIPRTTSGKIQRHACKDQFLNGTLDVIFQWIEKPIAPKSSFQGSATSILKPPQTSEALQIWLTHRLSEHLGVNSHTIDMRVPLTRYGIDSAQAVTLSAELEDGLGCKLPSTLLFDYPTLEALMNYLNKKLFGPEVSKTFEVSQNMPDESEANLTNLDGLSEDEIGALLDEKLAGLEEKM